MKSKLVPVTLELPDELTAELTITAYAKGLTLQEWVTILLKQAITKLPANPTPQTEKSQTLTEAAQMLTALETKDNEIFNAEVFEREFAQAQSDAQKS